MTRPGASPIVWGLLLAAPGALLGQATTTEVWPELDVYWNATRDVRGVVELSLATERESSKREATVGVFADYLRVPRGYARAGYRYTFSVRDDSYRESRAVGDLVLRVAAFRRLRLLNRTRGELRWVNGEHSWRLRDRLHLQRVPRDSSGRMWAPYGTAEVYYDSRFNAIPRLGGRVGTEVRVGGPVSVDVYVAHQHDTRPERRSVNALGVTTRLTY